MEVYVRRFSVIPIKSFFFLISIALFSSTVYAASSYSGCNDVLIGAVLDTSGLPCVISLLTPAPCEEIDLSGGKAYQFAWTTWRPSGFTWCETPYHFIVAGTPADLTPGYETNIYKWDFSAGTGIGYSTTHENGGFANFNANSFASAGLSSTTGVYHWTVAGWFWPHPATQTFRIITDDAAVKRISLSSATYRHNTIHAAYDASSTGDIIQALATTFAGGLSYNKDVTVTLQGGFDAGWGTHTGLTVIQGGMEIANGTVTVANIAVY